MVLERSSWERTTVGPLFTEFQFLVLGAVLFGFEGKDGQCTGFARTALAEILFPQETKDVRVGRVSKALAGFVVQRLKIVFEVDIVTLSLRVEREFAWKVKNRYPGGMQQVEKAIRDFEMGGGLVAYHEIQVPEEVLEPKQAAKPKQEKEPIVPNWASGGGMQKRPVEQFPPPRVPRAATVNPAFTYVSFVPPRDTCAIEEHQWRAINPLPGYILVQCGICVATGDVSGPEAEKKWAQLQQAMRERDNKAA